ncbi:MAG: tail fiber protein [Microbacteriaceae bacterium]|nr:tail fiber protein [Microbacteriaceae bacterium]
MSGGYKQAPTDDFNALVQLLKKHSTQISELERPTGSQLNQTVKTLQQLVDGLIHQTDINATGNATIGGEATIGGTGSFGGVLTANPGIVSTDARTRTGGSSLAGIWADGAGRFQINPSALRFKTGIETWDAHPERLLELRSVLYWLIDQDQSEPKQPGFIAEELIAAGFPEFVFYDAAGEVQGINYDRIVVLLLELLKYEDARIAAIEKRLTDGGL